MELQQDATPAGFIQLRVGGKRFETSLDVLLSEPDSIFVAMLRGEWGQNLEGGERSKPLVFDRDPKRFRVVLNWLRTRSLDCEDGVSPEGVLSEAAFFQLATLAEEVTYTYISICTYIHILIHVY